MKNEGSRSASSRASRTAPFDPSSAGDSTISAPYRPQESPALLRRRSRASRTSADSRDSLATSASEIPVFPLVGSSRRASGLELARRLGSLDHRLRDAVLDRARRVLALELRVQPDGRLGREPGELDERRRADQVEERGRERAGHGVRRVRSGTAGHRRQEDHGLAVVDRRIEAVEGADVLAAEVHVHERRELAVRVELTGEAAG